MSEVAGKLSVINGSNCLLTQNEGRGVLLGGTDNVEPGKVVVVGGGIAGLAATETALGMGAKVCLLDIKQDVLTSTLAKYKGTSYESMLTCVESTSDSLHEEAKTCLLYTSPSPRDATLSRMPSSA